MAVTAIYEYAGADASSYPGIGKIAIEPTGGQNRRIAISVIDADSTPRTLAVIVSGDSLAITDDASPITAFARYLVTGTPIDWGSYVEFPCRRTDTAGVTQPPASGTRLAVTPTLAAHDHAADYDPLGTLDDEAEITALKERVTQLEGVTPPIPTTTESGNYNWQATGGDADPGWGHVGWNPGVEVAVHKIDADKIAHDTLDDIGPGDQLKITSLNPDEPGAWVLTLTAPSEDMGAYVRYDGTITGTGGTLPPSSSTGEIRVEWLVPLPDDGSGARLQGQVYCSTADLSKMLGGAGGQDAARLAFAVAAASYCVDAHVGSPLPTWFLDPVNPVVTAIPTTPGKRNASLALAVRFYKNPENWAGVMNADTMGIYVARYVADLDLYLMGQRVSWGIA